METITDITITAELGSPVPTNYMCKTSSTLKARGTSLKKGNGDCKCGRIRESAMTLSFLDMSKATTVSLPTQLSKYEPILVHRT